MYIKSLTKVQEFTSSLTDKTMGVYHVEFDDDTKYVVVRNGNVIKAVVHGLEDSTLNKIRDEVRDKIIADADGLFQLLE